MGPQRFRFVDPANTATVRLDLNNEVSGWYLARGLDLGEKAIEKVWLKQTGVDGAEQASTHRDIVQMRIPLLMARQATASAMQTLYNSLVTELEREFNCIEYRPQGIAASYFIDTYEAPVPSLRAGADAPSPFALLELGQPIILTIDRKPNMTGAGTHI